MLPEKGYSYHFLPCVSRWATVGRELPRCWRVGWVLVGPQSAFYTVWWVIFICSSERSLMTACHRHLRWLFIIPQRLYLWMPRFFQIKVHENCTFGRHKGQHKSRWISARVHTLCFFLALYWFRLESALYHWQKETSIGKQKYYY